MNGQQLKEYMNAQRNEIFKYKWIESENAGYDLFPGNDGNNKAADVWITHYAASFKEWWKTRKGV